MSGGQIPPVVIAEELGEGIEGMGIGEAVVFDFSPNPFQGDMANGYPGLVADQFAELEKVLIGPGVAVTPAGLFFEHFLNLPDQAFISLHGQLNEFKVGLRFGCKINPIRLPARLCTNLYQRVQGLGCGLRRLSLNFITIYSNLINSMRLLFSGISVPSALEYCPAVAQDRFAGTENGYDRRALNLPAGRFLGTIRFRELYGGIIIGKGLLGDFPDSLNFIFDTGCGGLSLDSLTALRLKLMPHPSDFYIRGIAGMRREQLLNGMRLRFGEVALDSITMQVNNYDILTSVYGEQIDGILGYTFFSRYLVRVDYDSCRIDIYSKGPVSYPKGGLSVASATGGVADDGGAAE